MYCLHTYVRRAHGTALRYKSEGREFDWNFSLT